MKKKNKIKNQRSEWTVEWIKEDEKHQQQQRDERKNNGKKQERCHWMEKKCIQYLILFIRPKALIISDHNLLVVVSCSCYSCNLCYLLHSHHLFFRSFFRFNAFCLFYFCFCFVRSVFFFFTFFISCSTETKRVREKNKTEKRNNHGRRYRLRFIRFLFLCKTKWTLARCPMLIDRSRKCKMKMKKKNLFRCDNIEMAWTLYWNENKKNFWSECQAFQHV